MQTEEIKNSLIRLGLQMRAILLVFATASLVSAQSGSVCTTPEPLMCLSWASTEGNVTFTATYTGYEHAPVMWGAWGISGVF